MVKLEIQRVVKHPVATAADDAVFLYQLVKHFLAGLPRAKWLRRLLAGTDS